MTVLERGSIDPQPEQIAPPDPRNRRRRHKVQCCYDQRGCDGTQRLRVHSCAPYGLIGGVPCRVAGYLALLYFMECKQGH